MLNNFGGEFHLGNDSTLDSGAQLPDGSIDQQPVPQPPETKIDIELSAEDKAELESIEKEAGELVAKMTEFAKELGFDPEVIFTIENDDIVIQKANELISVHRSEQEHDMGNEKPNNRRRVTFIQTDLQILNSEDLLRANEELLMGSYNPDDLSNFGMLGVSRGPDYNNCFLNPYGQLINPSQSNNWASSEISGTTKKFFTGNNENKLQTSQLVLDQMDSTVRKLQIRIYDMLLKLGKVKEIESAHESRILREKSLCYRNAITRENTFSFAPETEQASRDLARLIVNIGVNLTQRISYICELAHQGDSRFHAVDINHVETDEDDDINPNLYGFTIESLEEIKTVYVANPSYAFTEADAKAAEEANLPWSRIEREKREAEAQEKA